jgi:signal transduction histidine kinase
MGMADASVSAPREPGPAGHPGPEPDGGARRYARRLFWPGGLSSRLLILTVLFATLAVLLILPLSLAQYEDRWLSDRVRAAELASLAADAAPNQVVSDKLASQLLNGAGVVSVAVQSEGVRRLVLAAPRMARTPYLVDLREGPTSMLAPFETLFADQDRMVRVVARPRFRDVDFVEIVVPDAPLRKELTVYLVRLWIIAALICAAFGVLVYLSLNAFFVQPMQRITRAMERFRADPEDPLARVHPSGRRDEIGRAEGELDRMQADLRVALNARARLAALGTAVAKINHDLRNMLTSAQIASERLASSGDPKVAQAMPRLERALDRAVMLATDVLAYGKSEEPAPNPTPVLLLPAIEAAAEDAGLTPEGVRLDCSIAPGDRVMADTEQLYRILVNLLRNAREAIAGRPGRDGHGRITVTLERRDGDSYIRFADDGPGIPERVLGRLFQPFAGSSRAGGTGLGLAIARELAQGHGGDLDLLKTGRDGATFELRLPGAPEPQSPRPRRGKTTD